MPKPHLPTIENLSTVTPRNFLYGAKRPKLAPGGIVLNGTIGVDGGNDPTYDIRAGWLLGRVAATGLYVPLKRTRVNGTTGSQTTITVDNAAAFVVGDVVTVGSDTDKTLTAVNYSNNTLTWSGAITVADNEVVFDQTSATATFVGILYEFVRLRNYQNMAAQNGKSVLMIGGDVNTAYLLGDWAAVLAQGSSTHPALKHFGFFTDGVEVFTG